MIVEFTSKTKNIVKMLLAKNKNGKKITQIN
jgi:hypothetical protein